MYKVDKVSFEEIFDYIDQYNYNPDEKLRELRIEGENNNIPIIKKDVENYLKMFLPIIKPKKILEIGCAIGYCSLFMSKTLNDNVTIDTLEISENMRDEANNNFKKFNNKNINVIFGDAIETIPKLDKKYDMVFMDASKGHYKEFFELIKDKLEENSYIICDNILFKGFLCIDIMSVPRRQRTIYRNMTAFLNMIKQNQNLSYNLLPLGDGLLVINIKKTK